MQRNKAYDQIWEMSHPRLIIQPKHPWFIRLHPCIEGLGDVWREKNKTSWANFFVYLPLPLFLTMIHSRPWEVCSSFIMLLWQNTLTTKQIRQEKIYLASTSVSQSVIEVSQELKHELEAEMIWRHGVCWVSGKPRHSELTSVAKDHLPSIIMLSTVAWVLLHQLKIKITSYP